MRFNRRSFIFIFALLLLCSVPIQAFAAPRLTITKQSVTYQGSGAYRCIVRLTNDGTSSTGTTDFLKLYADGVLGDTTTLAGDWAIPAGYSRDVTINYSLGSASSVLLKAEVSSSVSAYYTQSVTARVPDDASGGGGDGGGGGCNAGAFGLGVLGLAAMLPMRSRRRAK